MADKQPSDISADEIMEIFQAMVRDEPDALERLNTLTRDKPDSAPGFYLLSLYLFHKLDYGRSLEVMNKAHELDPDCREYADSLAALYTAIGKLSDGLYFAKLSTTLESRPEIAPIFPQEFQNYFEAIDRIPQARHWVRAMAAFNRGDIPATVRHAEMEIREHEDNAECSALLAEAVLLQGNPVRAELSLHAALSHDRSAASYHVILADSLMRQRREEEAVQSLRQALKLDTEDLDLATRAAGVGDYLSDDLESVRSELREAVTVRAAAMSATSFDYPREETGQGKKRVGILSDSLFDSITGEITRGLLENDPSNKFEFVCYQQTFQQDTLTTELKNHVDDWREVHDLQDEVLEIIMQGDQLDALIDVCGYSPTNRLGALVNGPISCQMSPFAPPFGIGVPGITHVLADSEVAPTVEPFMGADQKLIETDGPTFVLPPFRFLPDPAPQPATLAGGQVTFGGACDLRKLSAATIALWSAVLDAVPGSGLMLVSQHELTDTTVSRIVDLFAHFGHAGRIRFWEPDDSDPIRIGAYAEIDIFLDSAGASNPFEMARALWMGAPALSIRGSRPIGRMGVSALAAAGRSEWASDTIEEFAETAAGLASDVDQLAAIRSGLRETLEASALFDPAALVARLDAAIDQATSD